MAYDLYQDIDSILQEQDEESRRKDLFNHFLCNYICCDSRIYINAANITQEARAGEDITKHLFRYAGSIAYMMYCIGYLDGMDDKRPAIIPEAERIKADAEANIFY